MSAERAAERSVRVFPSGALLPENLLRMHVLFAQVPNVDAWTSAVRLQGPDGHGIEHAFVDVPGGLWDTTGRWLTLLLHPGRIKSGLAARVSEGPALQAGRIYRLVLDLGLLFDDAPAGIKPHVTTFAAGPALHTFVDAAAWSIHAPVVGSVEPVRLMFDRPMDRLGLENGLEMVAPNGAPVPFSLAVGPCENEALMWPARPWLHGVHHIQVSQDVEDLAGNRLAQAFEQIGATLQRPAQPWLDLAFTPAPAKTVQPAHAP